MNPRRHEIESPSRGSGEGGKGNGDREETVPGYEHAGGFHEKPGEGTGDVEARADGGFALGVEVREVLDCGELFISCR